MSSDDIIRMAREAGLWLDSDGAITGGDLHPIIPFAALVAAAEREACAKVCDALVRELAPQGREALVAGICAAAIRGQA